MKKTTPATKNYDVTYDAISHVTGEKIVKQYRNITKDQLKVYCEMYATLCGGPAIDVKEVE